MYGKEYLEWKERKEASSAGGIKYDMQAGEHDAVMDDIRSAKLRWTTAELLALLKQKAWVEAKLGDIQARIDDIRGCM